MEKLGILPEGSGEIKPKYAAEALGYHSYTLPPTKNFRISFNAASFERDVFVLE